MRHFKDFVRLVARFAVDRRANFVVAFATAIPVLALAVGYSLNTVQLVTVRSNLQNALDAAVTSTARDITTGTIDEEDARDVVEAFLMANADSAFTDIDRVVLDSVTLDRARRVVSASASVHTAMVFPILGMDKVRRVGIDSAAQYSDKKIEIAMMLDVTGSMGGDKIRDLRNAAKGAVTAFLAGQDRDNPRIRVAIVPYADAVNTGGLADTVHVESRFVGDEPAGLYDPVPAAASAHAAPDKCATERKGAHQFTDAGPETAKVNRDDRLAFCPLAALKPLSGNATTLETAIDGLRADGHTAGHIGVQWSWYMLSPRWAGVLPAEARPASYTADKVAKFAILMTDGEFNTAFAGVPRREATRGGQPVRSRNHAERLCREMRRDGIEIFTIGFMLKESAAKAVMRDCASLDFGGTQHYYEVADGTALSEAYLEIARNIERLAIID